MRVVAGEYKGHHLKTLKGDATRPTTMRVKESLFSSLVSKLGSFDGLVVLDAFAGSGSLGIEALSRGARYVVFCEQSRQAVQVVRENLAKVRAAKDSFAVEMGETEHLVSKRRSDSFDLVFFDPPYAYLPEQVFAMIEALDKAGNLNSDTIICYELAKKNKVECEAEASRLKWVLVSQKDFGDTTMVILRREL